MGGEALYERYKDALKRGHVASLRGRLEEALDAYAEASTIAPERPTPHVSAGTALLRRRRPADALRYYDAALRLAPRDETALLGRAQALVALGRRPQAADAFDVLAEVRASDGKLADAVDAARRGLELAEGRERRRALERLIDRLRASEPGEPGRLALERALLVLEGPAVTKAGAAQQTAGPEQGAGAAADRPEVNGTQAGGEIVAGPGATQEPEPEPVPPAEPQAEPESAAEPEPAAEPETQPAAPAPGALDRDVAPGTSFDDLAALAQGAIDDGRPDEAVERMLDLAAANRREGHLAAALDACYGALSLDPDNLDLHLALVQLYEEHGWTTLATEKLDLLDRLVALDEDADAAVRVGTARAGHA